jgi:hypothetical protein
MGLSKEQREPARQTNYRSGMLNEKGMEIEVGSFKAWIAISSQVKLIYTRKLQREEFKGSGQTSERLSSAKESFPVPLFEWREIVFRKEMIQRSWNQDGNLVIM